jgi:hypothetical protein
MNLNDVPDSDLDGMLERLHAEQARRQWQPPPQPRGITFSEFCERHGGDPIQVLDDDGRELDWVIPRDGTAVQPAGDGYFHTELTTPLEKLEGVVRHRTLTLRRLERDFSALKVAMAGHGAGFNWPEDGRYGPPWPNGIQALKHLQQLAIKAKAELKDAQAKLDRLPEKQDRRRLEEEQRAEERRRQQQEAAWQLAREHELSQINI